MYVYMCIYIYTCIYIYIITVHSVFDGIRLNENAPHVFMILPIRSMTFKRVFDIV